MRSLLLILYTLGCTARNPLYCDTHWDCAGGVCDVATHTCGAPMPDAASPQPDAAAMNDAAPMIDAAPTIDAAPADAAPHVCTSTCPLCSQNNRACCGSTCCGFGEWCDTSGAAPTCRCGSSNTCGFNTFCCAAIGQCGSQCRSSCL